MRFLSLFLLGFGLSASEQCFAITNQVAREIYREGDSVKVQDRIWLPLRRSQHLGGLGRILEAKSESTENLSREIEKFYKGEDLSVERFELSTNDSKFVLAVTSRVVFPATSVATLQLSPTYCGSLRPDPADSKDAEPLVRIISAGKHKYLLFPEWRLPDDDKLGLATVTNLLHLDSIVQEAMQLRSDLRIQCRLRVEEGESGGQKVLNSPSHARNLGNCPVPTLS